MKNQTQRMSELNGGNVPPAEMKRPDLVKLAASLGVRGATRKSKDELTALIQERGGPAAGLAPVVRLPVLTPVRPPAVEATDDDEDTDEKLILSARTVARLRASEERYIEREHGRGRDAGQSWATYSAEMYELRALEKYIEALYPDEAAFHADAAACQFWRIVRGEDWGGDGDAMECWRDLGITDIGGPSIHFVEGFAMGALEVLQAYDNRDDEDEDDE